MGCGSSRPQPGKEPDKLSSLIRRRVDSIRRRKKRVGDDFTMETTLSTKELLLKADGNHDSSPHNSIHNLDDDKVSKACSSVTCSDDAKASENEENYNSEKEREKVVVEAVRRAIEEVLMVEERENAEQLAKSNHVQNNDDDHDDDDNSGSTRSASRRKEKLRQMYVPQSPSFRVYCKRLESFDSYASKDDDVKSIESIPPKMKHGRRKTIGSGSVISTEEGSARSSKDKIEGRKAEVTKKAASPWKLGPPLGVKNLFVMSCYSCSAHNRTRLLSRG